MMRRHGVWVGVLVLAQVFLLTFSSLAAVERWVSLPLDDDGMYVLLVMGSDQGPPRGGTVAGGRADAIHLVVLDAPHRHVSILSFPRDTYVPVRGFGTTKINAMLTRGPENAVATMEDLTGLDVDDWILTGFDALIAGVDAFGGVHVDVERRLLDSAAETNHHPGRQVLSGWGALGYVRDRKSRPDGDIGRSTAQATLLRALHADLRQRVTSPSELLGFLGDLRSHTLTSIGPDRLLRLGALALKIPPSRVAQVTMPGSVGTAGRASVYRLSGSAYDIFADVRQDGRLAELDG